MSSPLLVILMGVSGSGKTTLGTLLAQRTGADFADADDFHSSANKAKMADGIPLTDVDRQPWLETLNRLLQRWFGSHQNGILACSALKAKYRETLLNDLPTGVVHVVFLDGSKEMIADRLSKRHHEYMTGKLLESQLRTLERPTDAICVVNDRPPSEVVGEILDKLHLGDGHGTSAI